MTTYGTLWFNAIQKQHYKAAEDQAHVLDNIVNLTQKNGDAYGVEMLSKE